MFASLDILKELTAKLEVLRGENISLQALDLLDDCKRLCGQLTEPGLPAVPARSTRGSVLVVDDDEDTLKVLRFALEMEGYRVVCVDGAERVEGMLAELQPVAIILDLMMPHITGFELLPKLKAHPQFGKIPVVVTSARTYDRDRIAALKSGARDFIGKPFNIEELLLRVSNLAD